MASSPHLRGVRRLGVALNGGLGFIPAPAGRSVLSPLIRSSSWLHSRTCGAFYGTEHGVQSAAASSPHLRGVQNQIPGIVPGLGFIPAPAGRSLVPEHDYEMIGLHPRTCGAFGDGMAGGDVGAASSPHLRGVHDRRRTGAGRRGFIPAPAGRSSGPARTRGVRRLHPRTCGAFNSIYPPNPPRPASSPHLRGVRSRVQVDAVGRGFIPAPAGRSLSARFSM